MRQNLALRSGNVVYELAGFELVCMSEVKNAAKLVYEIFGPMLIPSTLTVATVV